MFKEFREFAAKGNMIDLATGIIIGAAFGKIITSLVADVIMPPIGLLIGKVTFADLFINLTETPYATLAEAKKAGAATINYGIFLNNVLDFVIVAFVVFLLVRQINKLKREPVPAPPDTKPCPFCCAAIPLPATRCGHCTSQLAA